MPKIIPVQADVPNPRIKPVHPNIPQCPSLLLGIGSVRSGKTTLLKNLILRTGGGGLVLV